MSFDDVWFFNVALKDGHIVSRPKYEPQQAFIGSLVHELERLNPEFAWIQFVFRSADYRSYYSDVKHYLNLFHDYANTPNKKVDSEGRVYQVERKEKRWLLNLHAPALIKKANEVGGASTVVMGIHGLWVGPQNSLKNLSSFSHCADEIDGLNIFTYKDPHILEWLVKRKFVDNITKYFLNAYQRMRYEAPSLVLLAQDLPYYIHLPTGQIKLESLNPPKEVEDEFVSEKEVNNEQDQEGFQVALRLARGISASEYGLSLALITKVEVTPQPLEEEKVSMLGQLANKYKRSFEIIYKGGKTWFVLSSVDPMDLFAYENQLLALYGELAFMNVSDPIPRYIRGLVSRLEVV